MTFSDGLRYLNSPDKIELYRIDKNGLLSKQKTRMELHPKGHKIILHSPSGSYPTGVYYVVVKKGILSTSGARSKKEYYRKFYVREQ